MQQQTEFLQILLHFIFHKTNMTTYITASSTTTATTSHPPLDRSQVLEYLQYGAATWALRRARALFVYICREGYCMGIKCRGSNQLKTNIISHVSNFCQCMHICETNYKYFAIQANI
ncbi:hypothetical protein CIPAW_04G090600 [Carya illinoinensis]|uniref:Uncharacterized protein n=1 Tax=Carya illinoinensis TaxID=32201 RepID=A0A8T1QTU8_CARIL|nr:hypothetical protein CIPAW_04G090600 [Carya illinoinensis]